MNTKLKEVLGSFEFPNKIELELSELFETILYENEKLKFDKLIEKAIEPLRKNLREECLQSFRLLVESEITLDTSPALAKSKAKKLFNENNFLKNKNNTRII